MRKDYNKEKNTKWQSDKVTKVKKIKSTTKREKKVDWEEHVREQQKNE